MKFYLFEFFGARSCKKPLSIRKGQGDNHFVKNKGEKKQLLISQSNSTDEQMGEEMEGDEFHVENGHPLVEEDG